MERNSHSIAIAYPDPCLASGLTLAVAEVWRVTPTWPAYPADHRASQMIQSRYRLEQLPTAPFGQDGVSVCAEKPPWRFRSFLRSICDYIILLKAPFAALLSGVTCSISAPALAKLQPLGRLPSNLLKHQRPKSSAWEISTRRAADLCPDRLPQLGRLQQKVANCFTDSRLPIRITLSSITLVLLGEVEFTY